MAKKNLVTYGLIAAGVVAAIIIIRRMNKKSRSSVYADAPIRQTEAEFEADKAAAPSILETAGTFIKTIFPKKTAEQKAAKKTARLTKRAERKAKRSVAGIDDAQCLY